MHTQKTTRKPVQKPKPALAGQYRAIGSAAIVAALLYTPRRKAITSAK